jgi:uncharacterized membrane protein
MKQFFLRFFRKKTTGRFWEVDALRGVALIAMIIFHLIWDLLFFRIIEFDLNSPLWFWSSRIIGGTFIFLVGVSLALSAMRRRLRDKKLLFRPYLVRGAVIFCWGLIITFFTYIFIPTAFIFFGVLHLIGASVILGYFFLNKKFLTLVSGIILLTLGIWIQSFYVSQPWFVWLGLQTRSFVSIDYYPLLPWFGIVLFGIVFGEYFYNNLRRIKTLPEWGDKAPIKQLAFLGRYSLFIYLFHQPVLLILISIFIQNSS